MIVHGRAGHAVTLSPDECAEVVRDVTEAVSVEFRGHLPRTLIRDQVLDVLFGLDEVQNRSELRDVLQLVSTFRLASLDSIGHTLAPAALEAV